MSIKATQKPDFSLWHQPEPQSQEKPKPEPKANDGGQFQELFRRMIKEVGI